MRSVLIVGEVVDYLPQYGLVWGPIESLSQAASETSSSSADIYYCGCVYDTRDSTYLKEWWQEYGTAPPRVTLCTKNQSVSMEVESIIKQVEFRNLKDVLILDQAGDHDLLPPNVVKAVNVFKSIKSDLIAKETKFIFHPILSPKRTTMALHTIYSLGILSAPKKEPQPDFLTFFQRCQTAMGRRRLRTSFLFHPGLDVEEIQCRQRVMRLFIQDEFLLSRIQSCMSRVADLDRVTHQIRLSGRMPDGAKKRLLCQLASMIETVESLSSLEDLLVNRSSADLSSHEGKVLKKMVVDPLNTSVTAMARLKSLLQHVLNLDKVKEAATNPSAFILNPTLVDVTQRMSDQMAQLDHDFEAERTKVEKSLCDPGSKTKIKIIQVPIHNKIFRAPKSVHVTSKYTLIRVNKSECLFTSRKMKELNDASRECANSIAGTELAFITKTLKVCATYLSPLMKLADLLGSLDILVSLASSLCIASCRGWRFAEVVGSGTLELTESKHPLLEVQSSLSARGRAVVPNDVNLTEASVLLVTGPNMGGKSTYARQIALSAYFTQLGLPLPIQGGSVTPVAIFWARIGAHDNPLKGSSTFMTEAAETSLMLRIVEGNIESGQGDMSDQPNAPTSLLIIDELGRGTSSSDGLAFAAAILRKVCRTPNCLSIFATHFHELASICSSPKIKPVCLARPKLLEESRDGGGEVLTAQDISTLFRFKLREGVESDSDGITLAKLMGFPKEIVDSALQFAHQAHSTSAISV